MTALAEPRRRRPTTGICLLNAQKTECDRGHPFDAANTKRWEDRDGYWHRQCIACNRDRGARRRYAHPTEERKTVERQQYSG